MRSSSRLGRAALDPDERAEQERARDDQRDDQRRRPVVRGAAEAREEDDAREPGGEQADAEVVDRVMHALGRRGEDRLDDDERDHADRAR